jgi:hypothetical protein
VDGKLFGRFKIGGGNNNGIEFSPHYPLFREKVSKIFFDGNFIIRQLLASLDF